MDIISWIATFCTNPGNFLNITPLSGTCFLSWQSNILRKHKGNRKTNNSEHQGSIPNEQHDILPGRMDMEQNAGIVSPSTEASKVRGLTLMVIQKHINLLYQAQETKNKQNTPKYLQRQHTVENQYKRAGTFCNTAETETHSRIFSYSLTTDTLARATSRNNPCFICIWFKKYIICKSVQHFSYS